MVQDNSEGLLLKDDLKFAALSLFCEWGYVIDFDKNTFEVFEGENRYGIFEDDRFYFMKEFADLENGFYPIKLVKSYSLDDLPTEDEFLNYFQTVSDGTWAVPIENDEVRRWLDKNK